MDSERLKELRESIRSDGASIVLRRLIEFLEERDSPPPSRYALGVWNNWGGGRCPSTKDVPTLVDIELRSGEVVTSVHTGYQLWGHRDRGDDIVRFRMVTDEEEEERKEAEGRPTKETREWYAWDFQRNLSQIFKDGPPDSSFDDSSSESKSQPRSGGPFGCQPGQFVDRPSWRDW